MFRKYKPINGTQTVEIILLLFDYERENSVMYDISKIKLIIWDLDETLWNGTISEGKVSINPLCQEIIKETTVRGIVNSICSKNDHQQAIDEIKLIALEQYFVFNSINWEPKGQRIKQQIVDMNLRAENVLFIDDNHLNLEEAVYYNPGLMTMYPTEASDLLNNVKELSIKKSRLEQYRILETKRESQLNFSSNDEFLKNSNIQVKINKDCEKQLDRIYELIMRTNQLNFTKKRISKDELSELHKSDKYETGYVSVSDRFGEYGIVGFFACQNGELEHFLFSCRTIGMRIEQYIYAMLNYPKLTVVGDVAAQVTTDPVPVWINNIENTVKSDTVNKYDVSGQEKHSILFKGPCDLNTLFSFINDDGNIDCEFTYVNDKGIQIENLNHTAHIVQSLTLTEKEKQQVINELPFADEKMYSSYAFTGNYKVIFMSILNDANLGVYRRKDGVQEVAFGESYYPLTNPNNWGLYVGQKISTMNCHFTYDFCKWFTNNYEFEGRLSTDRIVSNIDFIRKHLGQANLVILTGTEFEYLKNENPAYQGRNLIHKEINESVRDYAKKQQNVFVVDVNNYIHSQNDFYNHYNHFTAMVYYEMAKGIVKLINEFGYQSVNERNALIKLKMQLINVLHKYYWKWRAIYRRLIS